MIVGPTAGGDYRRCLGCGLELRIIPEEESLHGSFAAAQEACYSDHGVLESPLMRFLHRRFAAARLGTVTRYLPRGRLLEVGPGSGQFLDLAKRKGYELEAIEHSGQLARQITERLGITVHHGMFDEMVPSGRHFDGIISHHVIEHVPDPLQHMRKAREFVSAGGYFFLATPNLASWSRWIAGTRWPGYSAGHVTLFNPQSLTKCLEQTRWVVDGVYTNESLFSWLWTAKYMLRKPRGVRPLEQAGRATRNMPYRPAVVAYRLLEVLSWPVRRTQSALGGGGELLIVAHAAE